MQFFISTFINLAYPFLTKREGLRLIVRMFDFVRGNPKKPCGNLLLYAHTKGHNSITSNAKFIVCNVVVSFISASDDHFPVVAFPPTILEKEEHLSALLSLNPEYDVVRLEDFAPPDCQEAKHYVRARIKNFNTVVGQYVGICREYFQTHLKENNLGDLALLSHKVSSKSSDKLENSGAFFLEESSCIDQLEQYIKVYETVPYKTHVHFHKMMRMMEDKYPYYDVRNFARLLEANIESSSSSNEKKSAKRLLEKSKLHLATLYLRKFRAIQEEKYEEAAKLQSDIRIIETDSEKYDLDPKNVEVEKLK